MKNIFNKNTFLGLLSFLMAPMYFAQQQQSVTVQNSSGGVGPGAPPKSPIDLYLYLLFFVAIGLIYYYSKRTRKEIV